MDFSDARGAQDVAAVEQLLRRAPTGTYVLTYNGFGGQVPASYEEIRVDRKLPNALRLWRKTRRMPRFPDAARPPTSHRTRSGSAD